MRPALGSSFPAGPKGLASWQSRGQVLDVQFWTRFLAERMMWPSEPHGSRPRTTLPALGDDARCLAFLELSTHPGREQGVVHPQNLVLEPDEGLILRLSEEG